MARNYEMEREINLKKENPFIYSDILQYERLNPEEMKYIKTHPQIYVKFERDYQLETIIKERRDYDIKRGINQYGGMGMDCCGEGARKQKEKEVEYMRMCPEMFGPKIERTKKIEEEYKKSQEQRLLKERIQDKEKLDMKYQMELELENTRNVTELYETEIGRRDYI